MIPDFRSTIINQREKAKSSRWTAALCNDGKAVALCCSDSTNAVRLGLIIWGGGFLVDRPHLSLYALILPLELWESTLEFVTGMQVPGAFIQENFASHVFSSTERAMITNSIFLREVICGITSRLADQKLKTTTLVRPYSSVASKKFTLPVQWEDITKRGQELQDIYTKRLLSAQKQVTHVDKRTKGVKKLATSENRLHPLKISEKIEIKPPISPPVENVSSVVCRPPQPSQANIRVKTIEEIEDEAKYQRYINSPQKCSGETHIPAETILGAYNGRTSERRTSNLGE